MPAPGFTYAAPCGCRYTAAMGPEEPSVTPCDDHDPDEAWAAVRAALIAQLRGKGLDTAPTGP